jgi:hypothetical protein
VSDGPRALLHLATRLRLDDDHRDAGDQEPDLYVGMTSAIA